MTVATDANDGTDGCPAIGCPSPWATTAEVAWMLGEKVRTIERLCDPDLSPCGLPAIRSGRTWRIWKAFVTDFIRRALIHGPVKLTDFAIAWRFSHGAGAAAAITGGPPSGTDPPPLPEGGHPSPPRGA